MVVEVPERRALVVALAVLLTPVLIAAKPPDAGGGAVRNTPQTHLVRAGASNPIDPATGESSPEHFLYTSYYPQRLQVHRGDSVRWEFTGGYGGWHTVTFLGPGADVPALVRADEAPGSIAFGEFFAHGSSPGDGAPCGRVSWWTVKDQEPCTITDEDLHGPTGRVASSLWDRFFAMPDTTCGEDTEEPDDDCLSSDPNIGGGWEATIELSPGAYDYFCLLHPDMRGTLEVVPDRLPLDNPSPEEIEAQIRADYVNAKATTAELSDPDRAYDAGTGEWTIHVGGDTPDRRVEILEFLPSTLPDLRRGDRVRFLARSQEPNSVFFHSGPVVGGRDYVHGGFNVTGRCGISRCDADGPGTGVPTDGDLAPLRDHVTLLDQAIDSQTARFDPFYPYGLTGYAFVWTCDYDDPASGAPGVPLAYMSGRMEERLGATGFRHGCPPQGADRAVPELVIAPWMAEPAPAPADLVTPGGVHSSGMLVDETLPDWYRLRPDGEPWPSRFEAEFPVDGTFSFFCNNHEFMRGRVVVQERGGEK